MWTEGLHGFWPIPTFDVVEVKTCVGTASWASLETGSVERSASWNNGHIWQLTSWKMNSFRTIMRMSLLLNMFKLKFGSRSCGMLCLSCKQRCSMELPSGRNQVGACLTALAPPVKPPDVGRSSDAWTIFGALGLQLWDHFEPWPKLDRYRYNMCVYTYTYIYIYILWCGV